LNRVLQEDPRQPPQEPGVIGFAREVLYEFTTDECPSMAAALSYYTVFALAPLLLIVIVVAGLLVSPEQASHAVDQEFRGLVGPQAAEQIRGMIENVRVDPGATVVARVMGALLAAFGATGVMVQIQTAMNRTWGVAPDPKQGGVRNFIRKRLLSFAMILAIAFVLLVSLALTALLTMAAGAFTALLPVSTVVVLQATNLLVSLLVVTALFAAIYRFMPEARVPWHDAWIGGTVTGVLFTAGKAAIGVVLGNSNVGSAFGAASSLAVVLVWVYYSSIVLLLGAEFTQVWSRRRAGAPKPLPGATTAVHLDGPVTSLPEVPVPDVPETFGGQSGKG
jgi:membrane protein